MAAQEKALNLSLSSGEDFEGVLRLSSVMVSPDLTLGGTQTGSGDGNSSTLTQNPLTWHAIHWASQQPHCVWVR